MEDDSLIIDKSPAAFFPPINGNYDEDFEDMDDIELRASSGKPKSSTRKKRTKKTGAKKKILAALKRASNLDDQFILPAANNGMVDLHSQSPPRKLKSLVRMEEELARDSLSMNESVDSVPPARKPITPPPNLPLAKIQGSRTSPRAGRTYKSSNSATMLFIDEPKLTAPSSLPRKQEPGLIPGAKALESINAIKLQNYAMRRRQHIAQKIKLLKDMRSFEREGSEEIIHAQKARNREILAAWKIRFYVEYFRLSTARKQKEDGENVNTVLTEQIQNMRQLMQKLRADLNAQKAAFEESQGMLLASREKSAEQEYALQQYEEQLQNTVEELRILRESHLTVVEELQLVQERHAAAAVKNNIMENELQITRLTCQEMVRTSAHKDNELERFPLLITTLKQQLSDKEDLVAHLQEVHHEERENALMREEDAELKKQKLVELLDLLQEKDDVIHRLRASLTQEQVQLTIEQAFHVELQAALDTAKSEMTTMNLEKDSLHRVIGDLAKSLQHAEHSFAEHRDQSTAVITDQQAQIDNQMTAIDMLEHEKRQLQFAIHERDEQIGFITEENHYLGTEIECYMMKTEELYEQNRLNSIAAKRSLDYSRYLEEELFTARRITANPGQLQPLYLPNLSSTQSVASNANQKRFAGPAVFEEGSVYYAPPHSMPVGDHFGHTHRNSDNRSEDGSVSQSFSNIRPHQAYNEFLHASSHHQGPGMNSSTASQAGGDDYSVQQQLNGSEHAAIAAYMSSMNLTPTGNSFGMDHKLLTLVAALEDKMNNMDKATTSLKILMEKAESLERQQTNRRSSSVNPNTRIGDGTSNSPPLRRAAMRKDVKNIRNYSNNHTDDEGSLDGQGSVYSVPVRDIDHPDFVGLKPSQIRTLQDEERNQHRLAKQQLAEEQARQAQEAQMLATRQQFIDEHVNMERAFLELQTNLLSISNELQQQKVDIAQLQEVRNKCKSEVNKWKKSFKKLNFGREPTEEERDYALKDYLTQIDYLRDQISLYKANNLTLNAKAIALQTELYHLNSDLEYSTKEFTKQFQANITDFYPEDLTQLMHAPQPQSPSQGQGLMMTPGKSFAFDSSDDMGYTAWGSLDSPTNAATNNSQQQQQMQVQQMMSVIIEGTDESPDAFATSILQENSQQLVDLLPSVLEGEGDRGLTAEAEAGNKWNENLGPGGSLESLDRSYDDGSGTQQGQGQGGDDNSTIRSGRSRRRDPNNKERSPPNRDASKDSNSATSPRRGNKDKKKRRANSKLKKSASTASSNFDAGNAEGFNHIDASFAAAADSDINPFLLAYGEMHDDHPLQPLLVQAQTQQQGQSQPLQLNTSQETLSTLSAGSLLRLQAEGGGLSPFALVDNMGGEAVQQPPQQGEGEGEGEAVLGIAEMAAEDQAAVEGEAQKLQEGEQQVEAEEEEDPTMLLAISIAEQVNLHAITHELISQYIYQEQTQATHEIHAAYEAHLAEQRALQTQQEEALFAQVETAIFNNLFSSLFSQSTHGVDEWLLNEVLNSAFERVFSRTLREEVDYLEEERKLSKPVRKIETIPQLTEVAKEAKTPSKARVNKDSKLQLQRQENLRLAQSYRARWSQTKSDLDLLLVDLQGHLDTHTILKSDFHESMVVVFDFHRQFVDLCGHPAEYMDLTRSKNFQKISHSFTELQTEFLTNLTTAQNTLKQAKAKLLELEKLRVEVEQNHAVLVTDKIIDLKLEFVMPEVEFPDVESCVQLDPFALRLADESRLLPAHYHQEEVEGPSPVQSRPVTTDGNMKTTSASQDSEQDDQEEQEQSEAELVDSLHMSVGLRQALGMTVRSMDEKALADAAAIWKPPAKPGLDDSSIVIKDMAAYFEDMGISWMNDAVKSKPQPASSDEEGTADDEDNEDNEDEEGIERLKSASIDSADGSPSRLLSRTISNHSPSLDQQPLETVHEEDDHHSLHSVLQSREGGEREKTDTEHKVRRTSMEFVGDLITTALSTKMAALTAIIPPPVIIPTEAALAAQLAKEDADDASLNKLLNHFELDAESLASKEKADGKQASNKQSSSSTDGELAAVTATSPMSNAIAPARSASLDENELLNALVDDLKQLSVVSEMSNSTISDPKSFVPSSFLSQAVNAASTAASNAASKLFMASAGSGKNNNNTAADGNTSRGPSRRNSIAISAASPTNMSGKNSASPSRRGSVAGALSSAVAYAAERATSPLSKSRRGSFLGGGAAVPANAAAGTAAGSRGNSAAPSRPSLSRGRSRAVSTENKNNSSTSSTNATTAAAAAPVAAPAPAVSAQSQTEAALKAEYLALKKELRDWKMNFMKENGGRAPAMADFHALDYDMQVKIARKNQLKKSFGDTLSSPSKKNKRGKSKKGSGLEADEEDDDEDMM